MAATAAGVAAHGAAGQCECARVVNTAPRAARAGKVKSQSEAVAAPAGGVARDGAAVQCERARVVNAPTKVAADSAGNEHKCARVIDAASVAAVSVQGANASEVAADSAGAQCECARVVDPSATAAIASACNRVAACAAAICADVAG